jgi:hypothetical protein
MLLRAPTQLKAPALGARRAGTRRGIGARKLTGAVDFSASAPRRASPQLAGASGKQAPPTSPKPGSPLDATGGLYSGGSLWRQRPPPKQAPPPPAAADDDDDWYSDAPKKGGVIEAAQREQRGAGGFDDGDGFFDAHRGSSRLAMAYEDAAAPPAPAPAPAPAPRKAPLRAPAPAAKPAATTAARDRFGAKKGFGSDAFFDEPGAPGAPTAPSAMGRTLHHGGIGSDAFFDDGAPKGEDGLADALSSAFSSLSRFG